MLDVTCSRNYHVIKGLALLSWTFLPRISWWYAARLQVPINCRLYWHIRKRVLILHILSFIYLFFFSSPIDGDLSIGISFHNWKQCWSHISDFLCGPQYPIYEYFTPQEVCIVLKYFLFRCTYFIWSISQASRLLCSSFVGDPVI